MKTICLFTLAALALAAGLWPGAGRIEAVQRPAALRYHPESDSYSLAGGGRYANLTMEEKLLALRRINSRRQGGPVK